MEGYVAARRALRSKFNLRKTIERERTNVTPFAKITGHEPMTIP